MAGKGNDSLKQGGPTSDSRPAKTTQRANPNNYPRNLNSPKVNSPGSGNLTNGGKSVAKGGGGKRGQ